MDVQPQNLEMTYHLASSEMDDTIAQINNAQQGEQALKQWSRTVENAVDRVICLQHKLDPLKKILLFVFAHAKGRCRFKPEPTMVMICYDYPHLWLVMIITQTYGYDYHYNQLWLFDPIMPNLWLWLSPLLVGLCHGSMQWTPDQPPSWTSRRGNVGVPSVTSNACVQGCPGQDCWENSGNWYLIMVDRC